MAKKENHGRLEAPGITRLSSKGQVVIPLYLRKKIHAKEGTSFAVSSINGDMILLKKVKNPITEEDIRIAKEVDEAWKEIERGEFTETSVEDFKKELDSW